MEEGVPLWNVESINFSEESREVCIQPAERSSKSRGGPKVEGRGGLLPHCS